MATTGAESDSPQPVPADDERPSGARPHAASGAGQGKPGPKQGKPGQGKPGPQQAKRPGQPGAKPGPGPGAKPGPQQAKPGPQQAKQPGQGPGAKPGPGPGAKPGQQPAPAQPAPVVTAAATAHTVKQLRRRQARALALRIVVFVLLPTALAGVYYGFIASKQYDSYSHFAVHSAEMSPSLGLEGLLGMSGGAAAKDTLAVRQYILSRDMLARLQREHQLIDHYKDPSADFLTRLPPDASFEEAFEYYQDKVTVDFDSTSGGLTLRVRALSAEKAQQFAKAIIRYSEEMVNELSQRERLDQIRYAEADVKKSEARLSQARQALLKQQQKHSELNPQATAASAMSLRTQLEGQMAQAQAELAQAKAFMKADSPKVRALQDRVNALAGQAAKEKRRMVDPKSESGIADSMAEFEEAAVEKEFAEKAYGAAMTALEVAREQASRQHRYLATIAEPSLPDESTHPERPLAVFTVFVLSFLLLGIGSLLVAAVREHARV